MIIQICNICTTHYFIFCRRWKWGIETFDDLCNVIWQMRMQIRFKHVKSTCCWHQPVIRPQFPEFPLPPWSIHIYFLEDLSCFSFLSIAIHLQIFSRHLFFLSTLLQSCLRNSLLFIWLYHCMWRWFPLLLSPRPPICFSITVISVADRER